jgi:hypothetical protein
MHRTSKIAAMMVAVLVTAALVRPAVADSFQTSVATNSRTAARVAPEPYTGGVIGARQAMGVAKRALGVVRGTRNLAIGHDVNRRVDSVAMDHPKVGNQYRLGLAKLARSNDPKYQLLRGANLVLRNADSRRGITYVRKAAKRLPNNSAAQLVAGLAVAQRDAFSPKFGQWDKRTPLKREAARYINRAQQLEAQAKHPRPLVREGIRQAKEYAGYYGGYKGLIK